MKFAFDYFPKICQGISGLIKI